MSFVELRVKRHRGWPWPKDSWGLTPMYGEAGWCRSCGTPRGQQTGSLVLKRTELTQITPAWVPNSQFDAICLDARLGVEVDTQFNLTLYPVKWATGNDEPLARQIVLKPTVAAWYDPLDLEVATKNKHGKAGARCPECGIWRWLPLLPDELPALVAPSDLEGLDVAASPEWFGDGWNSYRRILMRRELAELIASRSPKDFKAGPPARFR